MGYYCLECSLCGQIHRQKKHWLACVRKKDRDVISGKNIDKSEETMTKNTAEPIETVDQSSEINQIEVEVPLDCLCYHN